MEKAISIKSLIFQVLSKWRAIVTFALVVAVIYGGTVGYSSNSLISDQEALVLKEAESYEQNKGYTQAKAEYDNNIQKYTSAIESSEKYFEESILFNLDANDHHVGILEVYIDSLYEINPSLSVQVPNKINELIKSYESKISNSELYNEIASALGGGISSKHIKEVVTYTHDVSTGFITFKITMNTEDEVQKVSEVISMFINNQYDDVQDSIANHKIRINDVSIMSNIDDELRNKQLELKLQYNTNKQELEYATYGLLTLKEPAVIEFNEIYVVKEAIKALIIAGIIAGIISAGTVFVIALLSNKLESVDFIEENYKIFALAIRPLNPRKKNFIDNIIYSMFVDNTFTNVDEFNEYVKVVIGENIIGDKKIHVTGSIDKELISDLHKNVLKNIKSTYGANVNIESNSIIDLNNADGVILVEKRFSTDIAKLDRQIQYIKSLDKEILGVIVL